MITKELKIHSIENINHFFPLKSLQVLLMVRTPARRQLGQEALFLLAIVAVTVTQYCSWHVQPNQMLSPCSLLVSLGKSHPWNKKFPQSEISLQLLVQRPEPDTSRNKNKIARAQPVQKAQNLPSVHTEPRTSHIRVILLLIAVQAQAHNQPCILFQAHLQCRGAYIKMGLH